MRDALALIRDVARIWRSMEKCTAMQHSPNKCLTAFSGSDLVADVNLLIMPNLDSANISYNLLRVAAAAALRSDRFCWEPASRFTS
jgi:hypothetical protein